MLKKKIFNMKIKKQFSERLFYLKLFNKLFPIPRSITGKGYRKSLNILKKYIPFKIVKFNSSTKVFDWIVPLEWDVQEAKLINSKNKVICDYDKNNISLMSYSRSVSKIYKFKDIKSNLYTIKKEENLTPYTTSYYKKNWGFNLPYRIYKTLKPNEKLKVNIKSTLKKGSLDIGLTTLKGKSKKIVLFSTYLCHPSMANNELSGPLVMLGLYNHIKKIKNRKYNYMFLINPETIGSLCFLKKYGNKLKKDIYAGLVLTCLGGNNNLNYKLSNNSESIFNKIFLHLKNYRKIKIRPFDPTSGSDERQYCSPGFNLPMGQISKSVYGTYKEYHTDGDNLKFMGIQNVIKSKNEISEVIDLLELNGKIYRTNPYGEPFLSKYNLYPNVNFNKNENKNRKSYMLNLILKILSLSNGKYDLFDLSNIIGISIFEIIDPIKELTNKKIIYLK